MSFQKAIFVIAALNVQVFMAEMWGAGCKYSHNADGQKREPRVCREFSPFPAFQRSAIIFLLTAPDPFGF
jgi:hypothetical protein